MRLSTMHREGYTEPAVMIDGEAVGMRGAGFADLVSVIAGGQDALDRAHRWAGNSPSSEHFELEKVRFAAPIPRPSTLICIGLNYRDHAAESNLAIPEV